MNYKLALIILLLCPVIASAQKQPFLLRGHVQNLPAQAKLYINYAQDGQQVTDSIPLIKGNFVYKATVIQPAQATLFLSFDGNPAMKKSSDITTIYIEKGIVQLNSKDSLANAVIAGPGTNLANEELKRNLKPVLKAINVMLASRLPLDQRTEEYRLKLRKLNDSLEAKRQGVLKDFILKHPDNVVSLDALAQLSGPIINYDAIAPYFAKLSPAVRKSAIGKQLDDQLRVLERTAIGVPAPDFTEKDTIGKLISLSSFRGKYVLLDFWATWCGPCRAENPNVVRAYQQYNGKGFRVLSISLDSKGSESAWIKAIKADGMEWTNVSDFKSFGDRAAMLYGIKAIPQNFLIDPNGKIIAKNLRGAELDKVLSKIFTDQESR